MTLGGDTSIGNARYMSGQAVVDMILAIVGDEAHDAQGFEGAVSGRDADAGR